MIYLTQDIHFWSHNFLYCLKLFEKNYNQFFFNKSTLDNSNELWKHNPLYLTSIWQQILKIVIIAVLKKPSALVRAQALSSNKSSIQ